MRAAARSRKKHAWTATNRLRTMPSNNRPCNIIRWTAMVYHAPQQREATTYLGLHGAHACHLGLGHAPARTCTDHVLAWTAHAYEPRLAYRPSVLRAWAGLASMLFSKGFLPIQEFFQAESRNSFLTITRLSFLRKAHFYHNVYYR